jgi:hypothetical protein
MSSLYGKGAKGRATRLHSLVVRARGACENCGRSDQLQCAHIVTRRRNATRTDEQAAFCLCSGCHMTYTHDPLQWVDFVVSKIGREAYDAIQAKSLDASFKAKESFWLAECERLSALLKEAA